MLLPILPVASLRTRAAALASDRLKEWISTAVRVGVMRSGGMALEFLLQCRIGNAWT